MSTILRGEYTLLLLLKYGINICAVLFGFWSYILIVYIHLRWINTQQQAITPFSLLSPLSWMSVLCCTIKNTVLRFVWIRLIFIQLIIKFISIYPASNHKNYKNQISTSVTSYNLVTAKRQKCISGQLIVVRNLVTWI